MKSRVAALPVLLLTASLILSSTPSPTAAQEALPGEVSGLVNESLALVLNTLPRRVDEPLRVAVEGLQTGDRETRLGELFAMALTTRLVQREDDRYEVVALQHYESMMMADLPAGVIRAGIEHIDLVVNGKLYLTEEALTAVIQIVRLSNMTVVDGFERTLPASPRTRELIGSAGGVATGGDGYEPDSPDGARTLVPGQVLSGHSLMPEGDEDWFYFENDDTGMVTVHTLGQIDTYLEVYDAGDLYTILTENDDYEDGNARVVFYSSPGRRFIVKARGFSPSSTGEYGIGCAFEPVGEDSGEPDNLLEQAGDLSPDGEWHDRLIMPVGDSDWFAVEVPASMGSGAVLRVETAGDMDTVMELYAADGESVTSDDDSGEGNNARIDYVLPHTGRYYVQIMPYSTNETGPYRIRAELEQLVPDAYEPDNIFDQATLIEFNGASQDHTFTPEAEEDWIRFTLPENHNVTIETRGTLDTVMTLYDEGGNEIADDDDGGEGNNALIERYLPAGTYFVRITQFQGLSTSSAPYTVRVTGR